MNNKLQKNLAIASVVLLILASLPLVSGDSLLFIRGETKTIEKEMIEQNSIVSNMNKINLKKNFVTLYLLINFLRMRFNDYPKIVSLCKQVLRGLNILGRNWSFLSCSILFFGDMALWEIWYELYYVFEFYILAFFFESLMYIIEFLFAFHCSWFLPYSTISIQNIRGLSKNIQLSKLYPCPCMQQ